MIRKQLYIDEDLDRGLKRLTAVTGESEASHVRAALRDYLARQDDVDEDDPLARLVGMVEDPAGPTDVAEQHDRYLYEVAEPRASDQGPPR